MLSHLPSPTLRKFGWNSELIENSSHHVIDHVVKRCRAVVEGRHRRHDRHAHTRHFEHVFQMHVTERHFSGYQHQFSTLLENHIGCPVLCDRQYGGRSRITRGEIRRDPADDTVLLERQALHARRLRFLHPATGEPLEVEAPLPDDIAAVLAELRTFRSR